MNDADDAAELLFFDTFSHEEVNDINLDLVQFPKPVYITQVRIIPLGARVQADFPGGVRLGATNPSQFDIDFFVNDLGMPGAATFECLGRLRYNQNDCIHLECGEDKIPTDGLVLRGWYSTITLAVYGILTNSVHESIASPSLPCEPAGPEDMCNISGDALNVSMQDDSLKEDWPEQNLSGELMSHKASTSDYDAEEIEYAIQPREHYHQHGEQSEQREMRRMRRSSRPTIDRSPPLRTRTHSDSKERDYARSSREKPPQDWTRSPEYPSTSSSSNRRSRRKRSDRSRSDAEDTHKWPRTPPTAIESPARPRSPDNVEYMETAEPSTHQYKVPKPHGFRKSTEAPATTSTAKKEEEPIVKPVETAPSDELEPILSDDEIGDDEELVQPAKVPLATTTTTATTVDDKLEQEIKKAAENAPPIIEKFDPTVHPLQQFDMDLKFYFKNDLKVTLQMLEELAKKPNCANLAAHQDIHCDPTIVSYEQRALFLTLGDKLATHLQLMAMNLKRRTYIMQRLYVHERERRMAVDIIKLALDYGCALVQPQAIDKVRHIKIGVRLAEGLCNESKFFFYMLREHNFDVFERIFYLFHQQFMSAPLKLSQLKCIYVLLDYKEMVEHFLKAPNNGYRMIIEILMSVRDPRVKHSAQAIMRKLNLYESLIILRERCTELFVLTNFFPPDGRPLDAFKTIEAAFASLTDCLGPNALCYQQPRYYPPVTKKFEVKSDPVAESCYANALQCYFDQLSLAESMLVLLTNVNDVPATTFDAVYEMISLLLQSEIGLNYLMDHAFETTQIMVAVLLMLDDVPGKMKTPSPPSSPKLMHAHVASTSSMAYKAEMLMKIERTPEGASSSSVEEVGASSQEPRTPPTGGGNASTSGSASSPSNSSVRELMDTLANLGLKLAFKIQTRYHLDAIHCYINVAPLEFRACDHLHSLWSQTCSPVGRRHTIPVLGMNNNMQMFMDIIIKEKHREADEAIKKPESKFTSPMLMYAFDMIDVCVRHCEDVEYLTIHGSNLLKMAKNHATFESSISKLLLELSKYLKPLGIADVFTNFDLKPLLHVIKGGIECISTFPGDLITSLRILRHLVFSRSSKFGDLPPMKGITKELKYRRMANEIYSQEGVPLLMQVLEGICNIYNQPGWHDKQQKSKEGLYTMQIFLPTLQILRDQFCHLIQFGFRDLTYISTLMRVYVMLYYFPSKPQTQPEVEQARLEVIKMLLAYTQPNNRPADTPATSLWTRMVREVICYITLPNTFMPGLQLLVELLPLPLPMPLPLSMKLEEQQTQRLITERKLWSAHLHPLSNEITTFVDMLAPTSCTQLSELLQRVCMQLSDLAPNMALLIAKVITEMLCNEFQTSNSKPTAQLARLLNFSSRLFAFAPIKSSTLSILAGKFFEMFQSLFALTDLNDEVISQCQVSCHHILESFLDSGISLISHQSQAPKELNLASALPPKELIPRIVEVILLNVFKVDIAHCVSGLGVRNLVILTEHDFTFYHLSHLLKQKAKEFQAWIAKNIEHNKNSSYNSNIELIILLLRSLNQVETPTLETAMPKRTLVMNASELAQLLNFQTYAMPSTSSGADASGESSGNLKQNLLQRILYVLNQHKNMANEDAVNDLQELIYILSAGDTAESSGMGATASAEDEASASSSSASASASGSGSAGSSGEPQLPQAESLVTQYDARPIFTRFHPAAEDFKLTSRYWLQPLPIEMIEELDEPLNERIPRDLGNLAQDYLPLEETPVVEVKPTPVLQLSPTPPVSRERSTPAPPCFRTRRVEVEPSTGRPEKKTYASAPRARGYQRPPPVRGDLFRSRPPNTSRPPSLHVDDFLALEGCGAQPTGPTGYNKIPPIMRGSRMGRNRGARMVATATYKKKLLRTSGPSPWHDTHGPYRSSNPDYGDQPHFSGHYSRGPRGGRLGPRGGSRSYHR